MMKNPIQFLMFCMVCTAILFACTKEDLSSPAFIDKSTLENRDNDVWICHNQDGNNPIDIWVDESAVEAHLEHGDVLLDADGDGYTALNTCGEGTMDDCDDSDAGIHPGAEEICDDGIDNNCDGEVDENCSTYDFGCTDDPTFGWGNGSIDYDISEYNTCYTWTGEFGTYNYSHLFVVGSAMGNYYYFEIDIYDYSEYNGWWNCLPEGHDYVIYYDMFGIDPDNNYFFCGNVFGYACFGDTEPVTETHYLAALAYIENLASQLEIDDQCGNGIKQDNESGTAMQQMPEKMKKLLERGMENFPGSK